MKSETKQYIRENMMKIYWLGAGIFVLATCVLFNVTCPPREDELQQLAFAGMNLFFLCSFLIVWMFMIREDVKKNEKMIEDLQEHIERLGFSDREE